MWSRASPSCGPHAASAASGPVCVFGRLKRGVLRAPRAPVACSPAAIATGSRKPAQRDPRIIGGSGRARGRAQDPMLGALQALREQLKLGKLLLPLQHFGVKMIELVQESAALH